MNAPATDPTPAPAVTMPSWEVRGLELVLIIVGCAILVFAGVMASFPTALGSASRKTEKMVTPVTTVQAATTTTAPTMTSTTDTVTRGASETLLTAVFGLGVGLVLVGGFFRRVRTVSFAGIQLGLDPLAATPAEQSKVVQKAAQKAPPGATPSDVANIIATALANVREAKSAKVTLLAPRSSFASKIPLLRRLPAAQRQSPIVIPAALGPISPPQLSDDEIDLAVSNAIAQPAPNLANSALRELALKPNFQTWNDTARKALQT